MKRKLPATAEYLRKHVKTGLPKFAVECGISRTNVYLYYDGQSIPKQEIMQRIVNFFGVPFTITLTPGGKK